MCVDSSNAVEKNSITCPQLLSVYIHFFDNDNNKKNDSIDVYYVQLVPKFVSVETKRGESLSNFIIKEGLFTINILLIVLFNSYVNKFSADINFLTGYVFNETSDRLDNAT